MIFLDSSLLVPLFLQEKGTAFVRRLLAVPQPVTLSDLAKVEFRSAVARKVRSGDLDGAGAQDALSRFEARWPGFDGIPVGAAVLGIAARLVERHPLRSLDAIHLASALLASEGNPAGVRFGSADRRLRAAARAEGLEVIPVA